MSLYDVYNIDELREYLSKPAPVLHETQLVKVELSARSIAQLIHDTRFINESTISAVPCPFPADMQYVRAFYDSETEMLSCVFEHPSFYPTREGSVLLRVNTIEKPVEEEG